MSNGPGPFGDLRFAPVANLLARHPTAQDPERMILLTVKLRTSLSEEELLRIAHERAPEFRVSSAVSI